ncbi:MAG: hypothetical protein QM802_18125 [Agriterribacter sp.]
MSQLLTKISFRNSNGFNIISFTSAEEFKNLVLLEDKAYGNHTISVNDTITIQNQQYVVKSVFSIIHGKLIPHASDFTFGFQGQPSDCNFEVIYYVDIFFA